MTNINCSEACRHQKNGKCQLTHVGIVSAVGSTKCAYFQQKQQPDSGVHLKSET
ncbi:MAG TPA: hydroxymyristoyl-ACP dehydratase [Bacillota bacterium]|nr:hydroxymyristoyl-ACP dehydratase [Bacillota bacterium]